MRKNNASRDQLPIALKGVKPLDRANSRGISPITKQSKNATPLKKSRYITPNPLSPKGNKIVRDRNRAL